MLTCRTRRLLHHDAGLVIQLDAGQRVTHHRLEPDAARRDLSPATGITYLAAHKAAGMLSPPKIMGPWVVQWHIDGDQITYREINCLGTAVREATGTLEDGARMRRLADIMDRHWSRVTEVGEELLLQHRVTGRRAFEIFDAAAPPDFGELVRALWMGG